MLTENQKAQQLELDKARLLELDGEIDKLKKLIAPMQEQLDLLLETRKHRLRVLELENGGGPRTPRILRAVPRKPSGDVHWQAVADQYGYDVGGDSAHRVVARLNPALHASIEHQDCAVEKRSYP